ncbi:rab-like gtpase activating protein, putative [Ichthyophthirius multifiliis]|uniref:Rab-like gtpase activating protein, putative n=1 Tax=Ichthyophthirius multifiliis TaxID=5932 RepID=G0QJ24_ICHMU|nr:rab-like gtpase activating protein, putative [Ichthyophthirius multifiliis]EGR34789.1 rab-like gtpase activating protein, putative [Ichthyophthirius multifiliis]|eukprot:XP_004040093.1 rab-like gtpase activating protein, putative [Ichthyophthirius multifiliis]
MELEKNIFKLYLVNDFQSSWLQKNRVLVWLKILKTDQVKTNYIELKNKIAMNQKHDSIEETINLDVNRSLHMHSDKINPNQLQSLLRVFAYYNADISYCQGMNYIAGFLYLNILDEAETYKAFETVMNSYFSLLLTDNFEYLKVVFYQIERLLSIFLPELEQHLKQQNVYSNYYATGWLITIFSCVFQYTKNSFLLCTIWDFFLCEGWKGFFKCLLWVLKFIQPKLMKMDFDELLHCMSELIKSDIFICDFQSMIQKGIFANAEQLKKEINTFKVTNSLLKNLENEYNCYILNVKKKLQIQ